MDSWYALELGEATMAMEELDVLQSQFLARYEAKDRPVEMAMFVRHVSEGRLHCEVIAYFSPMAGDFAMSVGARICGRPARMGLGLFAGGQGAWDVLF